MPHCTSKCLLFTVPKPAKPTLRRSKICDPIFLGPSLYLIVSGRVNQFGKARHGKDGESPAVSGGTGAPDRGESPEVGFLVLCGEGILMFSAQMPLYPAELLIYFQ